MTAQFSKYQVATAIAILFHCIGITGILFSGADFFIRSTPINLLLMFVLLLWTQERINISFCLFAVACLLGGFVVEVIGVNTAMLFGNYSYGDVLGPKWQKVPLIIGVNWFIIIYCSGISINMLFQKIAGRASNTPIVFRTLSVIIDGSTIAVLFDWLMEPVAVKLNYWQWIGDGSIPFFNYACWFVISILLLAVFHFCKFEKHNKFAVNLLLIQVMFFLLLRTFMT